MTIELLGWIGSILFGVCTYPQVYKTWTTKRANDLSLLFLILWALGELFTVIYILINNIQVDNYQYPLYLNYLLNGLSVGYLLYARVTYDD